MLLVYVLCPTSGADASSALRQARLSSVLRKDERDSVGSLQGYAHEHLQTRPRLMLRCWQLCQGDKEY